MSRWTCIFKGLGVGPGVVMSGPKFLRRQVTSAVLQESVLGPALSSSSIHEWMMKQSTPSASLQVTQKSGWYTRGLCHHSERSCCAEKLAKRNLINLDKKCKVLHLGRKNAGTSSCWRLSVLQAVSWSFSESDFGVLGNRSSPGTSNVSLGQWYLGLR